MVSKTLISMEKTLGKIFVKPIPKMLAELQEIAANDKKNPAPHLAMVIVNGFYGVSRLDLEHSKRHLADAEKLLKEGAGEQDIEWKFSESLFHVLKNEFARVDVLQHPQKKFSEAKKEEMVKVAIESRRALIQMGRLVRRLRDSTLVNIIYAALRTLSLNTGIKSKEYRRGMASLSHTFRRNQDGINDLAGFFLTYGYRKNRNYRQAIRIGKILEKRNPKSPLPKKMLGTAFYGARKYRDAESYYKKMISLLTPNDPSGHICYVKVLEKMGKLEKAREELETAQSLDRAGELTSVIEQIKTEIKIKEKFMPQLKEVGLSY